MREPPAEDLVVEVPGFPLPFGYRRSLLGPSCARRGVQPPSRSAHQVRTSSPGPRRGCHVPHETDTTGLGALCTPGTVVRSRPAKSLRAAPATSQWPAPISHCIVPSAGVLMTRRQRGFTLFTRPVFPSLSPPDGTGTLGLSPGFAPRSYPRRTPRWGRSLRTGPDITSSTSSRTSFDEYHYSHATSCRTIQFSQDALVGVNTSSTSWPAHQLATSILRCGEKLSHTT